MRENAAIAVYLDGLEHTEASAERAYWRHVSRCLFQARTLSEWEGLVLGEP